MMYHVCACISLIESLFRTLTVYVAGGVPCGAKKELNDQWLSFALNSSSPPANRKYSTLILLIGGKKLEFI